jgi:hypothetical protein
MARRDCDGDVGQTVTCRQGLGSAHCHPEKTSTAHLSQVPGAGTALNYEWTEVWFVPFLCDLSEKVTERASAVSPITSRPTVPWHLPSKAPSSGLLLVDGDRADGGVPALVTATAKVPEAAGAIPARGAARGHAQLVTNVKIRRIFHAGMPYLCLFGDG